MKKRFIMVMVLAMLTMMFATACNEQAPQTIEEKKDSLRKATQNTLTDIVKTSLNLQDEKMFEFWNINEAFTFSGNLVLEKLNLTEDLSKFNGSNFNYEFAFDTAKKMMETAVSATVNSTEVDGSFIIDTNNIYFESDTFLGDVAIKYGLNEILVEEGLNSQSISEYFSLLGETMNIYSPEYVKEVLEEVVLNSSLETLDKIMETSDISVEKTDINTDRKNLKVDKYSVTLTPEQGADLATHILEDMIDSNSEIFQQYFIGGQSNFLSADLGDIDFETFKNIINIVLKNAIIESGETTILNFYISDNYLRGIDIEVADTVTKIYFGSNKVVDYVELSFENAEGVFSLTAKGDHWAKDGVFDSEIIINYEMLEKKKDSDENFNLQMNVTYDKNNGKSSGTIKFLDYFSIAYDNQYFIEDDIFKFNINQLSFSVDGMEVALSGNYQILKSANIVVPSNPIDYNNQTDEEKELLNQTILKKLEELMVQLMMELITS